MTQSVSVAQRIDRRLVAGMPSRAFADHVAPPSAVVRNSDESPTAKPCVASRKANEWTARTVLLTSVHEFAPSVVR